MKLNLTKKTLGCLLVSLSFFTCSKVGADSDMIQADRQGLAEAQASGISSKIIAAKEQLSDDLQMEQDQRRQDTEGEAIPLSWDDQGHLVADVLINNTVHASLIVDTGSPVILLTSSFIQELGFDVSQFNNTGYVEVLNGKHKAAVVSLDSVKIGGLKAHDVGAVILLEDSKGIKDGLLGMSFLSKFHFTVDQKGQKLILKKLPEGTF